MSASWLLNSGGCPKARHPVCRARSAPRPPRACPAAGSRSAPPRSKQTELGAFFVRSVYDPLEPKSPVDDVLPPKNVFRDQRVLAREAPKPAPEPPEVWRPPLEPTQPGPDPEVPDPEEQPPPEGAEAPAPPAQEPARRGVSPPRGRDDAAVGRR